MTNIPTNNVRKLRWTWAADLQPGNYVRSEFQVTTSQWQVTGTGRQYFVAGPGSRRIEDDDDSVSYISSLSGTDWSVPAPGNYSGSRIRLTQTVGASCVIHYAEPAKHQLYVGTRLLANGALMNVSIDGDPARTFNLSLSGEDVLVRLPLGAMDSGAHTIVLSHAGAPDGSDSAGIRDLFFDFLEIVHPSMDLPDFPAQRQLSLATDWDTLHSIALPAERTAWMIWKLGFHGRVNHYVGAIWFYELFRPGQQYATVHATIGLSGDSPAGYTEIDIGTGLSRCDSSTSKSSRRHRCEHRSGTCATNQPRIGRDLGVSSGKRADHNSSTYGN